MQVIKTAKVVEIDNENNKKVTLYIDEFYAPCFAVGDSVLKAGAVTGTFASAPTITAILPIPCKQACVDATIYALALYPTPCHRNNVPSSPYPGP